MADPASNDLSYGQFGRASYDIGNQAWLYTRSVQPSQSLVPVGAAKIVVPAWKAGTLSSGAYEASPYARRRHERQVQDVVCSFSELQPASDLLPSLLRASEALEAATAHFDPLKGSLLAIGTIPSDASRNPITVAAFPTGSSGSGLRLVEVKPQKRGWDDSKDAWIEVPTVHGEEALWHGGGAPIQQICFAHAVEGSDAYLAVRLVARTLVFRPILRKRPVHISTGTRLDLKTVCELPIDGASNLPHADVTFNPWYARQCGIVDQSGRWSIWDLEGRASKQVKLVCESASMPESSNSPKAVADGWARILWVTNPTTIAVCSRRELIVFDISGKQPTMLHRVHVDLSGGLGSLLDVTRLPSHLDHLCILTATHILVDRLNTHDDDALLTTRVFSMRHFRSPEDITLRLQAFARPDCRRTPLSLSC